MGIKCCYGCVAPDRHPGCHDHCEEYLAEKAEHIRIKDLEAERRRVNSAIYGQRSRSVLKALKKKGRY